MQQLVKSTSVPRLAHLFLPLDEYERVLYASLFNSTCDSFRFQPTNLSVMKNDSDIHLYMHRYYFGRSPMSETIIVAGNLIIVMLIN